VRIALGDSEIRVAQDLHYDAHIYTLLQQQRRRGVAAVVQAPADTWQVSVLREA
jgi:hypothetical protein